MSTTHSTSRTLARIAVCASAIATAASVIGAPRLAAAQDAAAQDAAAQDADRPWWRNIYVRAGALHLMPLADSEEVTLSGVAGPASLALESGPIPGSAAGIEPVTVFAVTAGYVLERWQRRVSIEGIVLSVPFPVTMTLTAEGALAEESLAPFALGGIPTGVPALGAELGRAHAVPPLVTAVYSHFRGRQRFQPYVGAGVSYLIPLGCEIDNPVLTEVAQPRCEIPLLAFGNLGFVGQAGVDVSLGRLFLNLDVKYIEKLSVAATVKDVQVRTPALPLYGSVRVGDATARVGVDPLLVQLSVGLRL